MQFHMFVHLIYGDKRFLTGGTIKWPLVIVQLLVGGGFSSRFEFQFADGAHEQLLDPVAHLMDLVSLLVDKLLEAYSTLESFGHRDAELWVSLQVTLQDVFPDECFVAYLALVGSLPHVFPLVRDDVLFVLVTLVAEVALESRFLTNVYAVNLSVLVQVADLRKRS